MQHEKIFTMHCTHEEWLLGRCVCGSWEKDERGMCKQCAEHMAEIGRKMGRQASAHYERAILDAIAGC